MMSRNCERLEIDTKDICLLCLKSSVDTNFLNQTTLPSLQGLKHLLRYLKVSPKMLFNCSTEFLQWMNIREDIDLKINLCSGCSLVTHKFNKLYQEYELIQLQIETCVQSVYQSISEGNESPERVRKYKEQMRPTKSSDLVNASIAANFRDETAKKCFLKLKSGIPRVAVQKLNSEKLSSSKAGHVSAYTNCYNHGLGHEATLAPSPQDANESQFHFNEMQFEVPMSDTGGETDDADNTTSTDDRHTFIQMTNKKTSGVEVVAKVKPVKANTMRKKNYFNSIRKKLKTTCQQTSAVSNSTLTLSSVRGSFNSSQTCEHCKIIFSNKTKLKSHISVCHSEHLIIKYLPSDVSLEHCKRSLQQVWEQMFQTSSIHCPICIKNLCSKRELMRHMICSHPQEIAVKVYENVPSLPEECPKLPQAIAPVPIVNSTTRFGLTCEYCNSSFTASKQLNMHMGYKHPEHVIYKYFPPHISLESCRKVLDVFFAQTFQSSKSGFQCKFCAQIIARKTPFKIHTVYTHGKRFAQEAQKILDLIPQHLEGASSDVLANSTNHEYRSDISTNEDICEFGESSMLQETVCEIKQESVIKLEHSSEEILGLDLDPLDMG